MPKFIPTPFEMIILNTPKKFLNNELKRTRNNVLSRKWKSKNPEKVKEGNRKYYNKNIEKERKRHKKYRSENLEKEKERTRIYRLNNKEKEEARIKKWRADNPEKHSKQRRKDTWKSAGVNMDFFEEIYDIYLTTTHCDFCNVELTDGKKMSLTTKCLDHSHVTGEVRNILCNKCNIGLPKHS